MKTCSRCGEDKSFKDFRKKSKSKDGLSSWCRECFALYDRERYLNGDNVRKKKNKLDQLERKRIFLWSLLCSSNCLDCGNNDPEVLEFDHRDPELKIADISNMIWTHSWTNIVLEIEKCDIVCANCHRKRTIKQFGHWRGTILGHEEDGNPSHLG